MEPNMNMQKRAIETPNNAFNAVRAESESSSLPRKFTENTSPTSPPSSGFSVVSSEGGGISVVPPDGGGISGPGTKIILEV